MDKPHLCESSPVDKPLICEFCDSTKKMYCHKSFESLCSDCERIKWLVEQNLGQLNKYVDKEMKNRIIFNEFMSIITSSSPYQRTREFLEDSIPPRNDENKIMMIGEKQYVVGNRAHEIKLKMAYIHGQSDVDFLETLLKLAPDGIIALFSSGKSWNDVKHHFESMDSFIDHLVLYVGREERQHIDWVIKFVQLWKSTVSENPWNILSINKNEHSVVVGSREVPSSKRNTALFSGEMPDFRSVFSDKQKEDDLENFK